MTTVKAELLKKSVRITNGGHSYKMTPRSIIALSTIKIDEFKHSAVSAVVYKVLAETKTGEKEIFDVHVLADNNQATVLEYGKLTLGTNLVNITVEVTQSKVIVKATSLLSNQIIKIVAIPTYFEAIA